MTTFLTNLCGISVYQTSLIIPCIVSVCIGIYYYLLCLLVFNYLYIYIYAY